MRLAVRRSSYGCTWEVWRTLKKLELLSAAPRAHLTLLSCCPKFPRASITRYTHSKLERILIFRISQNTWRLLVSAFCPRSDRAVSNSLSKLLLLLLVWFCIYAERLVYRIIVCVFVVGQSDYFGFGFETLKIKFAMLKINTG